MELTYRERDLLISSTAADFPSSMIVMDDHGLTYPLRLPLSQSHFFFADLPPTDTRAS
jgi:hypothetical protein